jgi:hypothetical protein
MNQFMLALRHIRRHRLNSRQLFQTAYMWKWTRDIADMPLCNDLKSFHENHAIPIYLRDYLHFIYD